MAEIVNLMRARKRRARAAQADAAQENRIRFGRTIAERECHRRAEASRLARLEDRRLTGEPPTES